MDSHTLEVMADQVDQEVEALRRREMEVELQLKFVRAEMSAKRATLRLLRKAIGGDRRRTAGKKYPNSESVCKCVYVCIV